MKKTLHKQSGRKTVIGVAGVFSGAGVTHFVITLANYAVERWNQKVAVIGWEDRDEYQKLCTETKGDFPMFRLLGVDYYSKADESGIVSILNRGYDYYLIDFGTAEQIFREEYQRCDRKVIIGSCSPWRKREFINLFETITNHNIICTRWDVLAISGIRSDKKEVETKIKQKIQNMPFLEDPFQAERKNFDFLEQFL